MSAPPVDPRAASNALLDEAERLGIPVTNLALQKILYFAHGLHLVETKAPLVSGYFEAWQFGPVHPTAYASFKAAKDQPIAFRATGRDALTGKPTALKAMTDESALSCLRRIISLYGRMTPGRLVELSHAKGAPWQFVVENAKSTMALGLRIPDDVIVARFKYHKVSVGSVPSRGEPSEDTPFA